MDTRANMSNDLQELRAFHHFLGLKLGAQHACGGQREPVVLRAIPHDVLPPEVTR